MHLHRDRICFVKQHVNRKRRAVSAQVHFNLKLPSTYTLMILYYRFVLPIYSKIMRFYVEKFHN